MIIEKASSSRDLPNIKYTAEFCAGLSRELLANARAALLRDDRESTRYYEGQARYFANKTVEGGGEYPIPQPLIDEKGKRPYQNNVIYKVPYSMLRKPKKPRYIGGFH